MVSQAVNGKAKTRVHARIKDLPLEERPRERLVHHGPENLSTAELMAIILRTGSINRTALDLAKELILVFKDLRGLSKASLMEIAGYPGVGQIKAIQLKAAFELGGRLLTTAPGSIAFNQEASRYLRTITRQFPGFGSGTLQSSAFEYQKSGIKSGNHRYWSFKFFPGSSPGSF